MGIIERLLCWLLPVKDTYEKLRDGTRALYLRRWFLIGRDDSDLPLVERKGRLVIHKMCRSDSGRYPHDHPFKFITLPLWGGYWDYAYKVIEFALSGKKRLGPVIQNMFPGRLTRRDATHLHRVVLKDDKPCWTLVYMYPPEREWGFVDDDGNWIPRKEYKDAEA